jgi:hypothetical protein
MNTSDAILRTLESDNVRDENGYSPANIVDVIAKLSQSIKKIADSITDGGAGPGTDATDGSISCLTEAVMGVTGGLCRIAESITNLADAVRDNG